MITPPTGALLLTGSTKPQAVQTVSTLTLFKEASASSAISSDKLVISNIHANAGDWLVVCAAADNAGTNGEASLSSFVQDTSSNTYILRGGIVNRNPGATGTGISLGTYTCAVTSPLVGGAITLNFYPNTVCKTAVVYRVVTANGETLVCNLSGSGATGFSTYQGITVGMVQVGQVVIAATALEHNTQPAPDTDNINGLWSSAFTASALGGTGSTSACISSQYKITNGSGSQSYSTTTIAAQDFAVNWIVLSVNRVVRSETGQLTLARNLPHYYFGRIQKPATAHLTFSSSRVFLAFNYVVRKGVLRLSNKAVRAQIARTPLPDVRITQRHVDNAHVTIPANESDTITRNYIDSITVIKRYEVY